jgi:GT2 family glycosyltransferase
MLMRKDLFIELGGFDNIRTWGVEDVEIIRAWLFGYPVIVVPSVEIRHLFKAKDQFCAPWSDYLHGCIVF